MLFLISHVATHSSRVPTSGSQTGDTLGKALASVSVTGVVVGNQTHILLVQVLQSQNWLAAKLLQDGSVVF